MSNLEPPRGAAASPLLDLLERLGRTALAVRPGVGAGPLGVAAVPLGVAAVPLGLGPIRLERVETHPDGATLHLQVRGLGGLLDTTVPVRLTIQSVGAERTRCALTLPGSSGLQRLLGAGLERLPPQFLQNALGRVLGDAVTLADGFVEIDHKALARRLGRS